MMIEVNNLSKRYGQFLALDDISFTIEKGEVVGLLGPNGAGKTTCMKIITCFMPATAGRVSLAGHDIFQSPLLIKQKIGYLPENCPLYLDMEVESFLKFCAEVRGIEPGSRKGAVERVISNCALGTVTKKVIGHLSKGYRQRVGLAQALIHNPDILILDEPTSGLDPNQIRDIIHLINDLGKEKTVIHSTHILSEVEETSNRVLIINQGRIVAKGSPAELMSQSSGTTVYAGLQGEGVEARLKEADFVKDVSKLNDGANGFERYAIHGKDDNAVSQDLFKFAVSNNWVMNELNTKTASLEDVFSRLTRG